MALADLHLTPELLRAHAAKPETPFWIDEARQLLRWAADVIEAADRIVNEQSRKNGGESPCGD